MTSKDRFLKIIWSIFDHDGYGDKYKNRLEQELAAIDDQQEYDYFLDLFDKKVKYPYNQNNLLVIKLLRISSDFDINKDASYIQGDFPDIDSDLLPEVRDYIKNEWIPQKFGKDNVCSVGNYTTFGIKSSLIDMVRVHGKDRDEILNLTTKIGLKDEDGKQITWEKALEMYPELKKYCEINFDVANSSKRLLNRNRGMGVHASGLIIANQNIDNIVPLVRGKDGSHVSSFGEGLHGTDLSPLGLVKYDLLGLMNLKQVAIACNLIKIRHGLENICGFPGEANWTDDSYLADPEALAMAKEGRLKCIFQFDSPGIRDLVKRGGVTKFEDLVAYTSLFRPATMQMKMHTSYADRKNGKEKYEIHPLLEPILGKTYGIMVYQEQVMKILNVVGDIPLSHCEIIRKAISKKKLKEFEKYKEAFILNGQNKLNWPEEKVVELYNQVESFSGYGFNLSHACCYTVLSARLLYLKAHYPIEFYTAILSCENDDTKIKEYKLEAASSGININRLDLNKSGSNFQIVGDEIYIGFSKVKGIGEEVAEKIVSHQPYSSFEDFLVKFGTDASVVKPLIGLGIFGNNRSFLYEFYEFYKELVKKRELRDIRNLKSRQGILEELQYLITESGSTDTVEDLIKVAPNSFDFKSFCEEFTNIAYDRKSLWKTIKKYHKNISSIEEKKNSDVDLSMSAFVATGNIDEKMKLIYEAPLQEAEQLYYGFAWDTLLEHSPDFSYGLEFERFSEDETKLTGSVFVHVVEFPKQKISKKGTVYYVVTVEDANSRQERITFWEDDYLLFKEELEFWENDFRKGNFLKLKLKRPDPGFPNFTFEAPARHLRYKELPPKQHDERLTVLER